MSTNVQPIVSPEEKEILKEREVQKSLLALTQYPEWKVFDQYLRDCRGNLNRIDTLEDQKVDFVKGQLNCFDFILNTSIIAEAVLDQTEEYE